MVCKSCGTQLPAGSMICPSCHWRVPMKWYKFVICFQLFASAVLMILTAAMCLSGVQYGGNAQMVYSTWPGLKAVDVFMGISSIILASSAIIARQKLAHFTHDAVTWYLAMMAANVVLSVFYMVLVNSATGVNVADSSMVSSVVMSLLMIVINYQYFNKRKSLFIN